MYNFEGGWWGTNAFKVIHCVGARIISVSHHLKAVHYTEERQELKPQYLKCFLAASSLATRVITECSAHTLPMATTGDTIRALNDGIAGSAQAAGLLPRDRNILRGKK